MSVSATCNFKITNHQQHGLVIDGNTLFEGKRPHTEA